MHNHWDEAEGATLTIEARLRDLISETDMRSDTYKTALGTIVEQACCIEDWKRRSREWCDRCDKVMPVVQGADGGRVNMNCEGVPMSPEETIAAYRKEIALWIETAAAATTLINEQREQLTSIAAFARQRLPHVTSLDEAAVLWSIINATERE